MSSPTLAVVDWLTECVNQRNFPVPSLVERGFVALADGVRQLCRDFVVSTVRTRTLERVVVAPEIEKLAVIFQEFTKYPLLYRQNYYRMCNTKYASSLQPAVLPDILLMCTSLHSYPKSGLALHSQ
jgi:hypothetical protein